MGSIELEFGNGDFDRIELFGFAGEDIDFQGPVDVAHPLVPTVNLYSPSGRLSILNLPSESVTADIG